MGVLASKTYKEHTCSLYLRPIPTNTINVHISTNTSGCDKANSILYIFVSSPALFPKNYPSFSEVTGVEREGEKHVK